MKILCDRRILFGKRTTRHVFTMHISKVLLAISLSFLLIALFNLEPVAVQPPTLWSKTYGGTNDDWAYSLVRTVDGGFTFAGSATLDAWLVRTDSVGNVYWNKTYGGSGLDQVFTLVRTFDCGFAIAGVTTSFGSGFRDASLVRSDLDAIPEFPSSILLVAIEGFSTLTFVLARKHQSSEKIAR